MSRLFISLSASDFSSDVSRFIRYCALSVSIFALLSIFAANVSATTFTVTNFNDSGAGSLRQAVIDANLSSGPHTINFPVGFSGTILLTSGEIPINTNLTITGTGANLLSVERDSGAATNFRIFNIAGGGNATITNLTIKGGRFLIGTQSSAQGGGIFNNGTLNLIDSVITGNSISTINGSAQTMASGGGIYNTGTLSLTNCVVSGNTSNGTNLASGGGITSTNAGNLTLTNTKITGNQATANTTGLTNSGCGCGGGVDNAGTANFTDVSVSGNTSTGRWSWGGGVNNSGNLTISKTAMYGNTSRGSSNREAHGGAIRNSGTLNLTNSTISGNFATNGTESRGGGLYLAGATSLKSVTVTNNTVSGDAISIGQGGGIYGSASIYNTIIAKNTANPATGTMTTGFDLSGSANSLGNNLIGDTTGSTGWTGSDLLNQNAELAPLGDYGGLTLTHALYPTSPAINAGNNANAPATDQRGATRIIDGTIDIGAFENSITISPGSLPDGAFGVPYNQTLSAIRLSSLSDESFFISNRSLSNQLPPFSFDLVGGTALPGGLTLSQSGNISGTPTSSGTYTFIVRAVDSDGIAGVRQYSINIPCSYSLGSNSLQISGAGGNGSFTVNTLSGCSWTTVNNDSWISITSGGSGSGTGTVQFSVQPNADAKRSGTVTAAGQTFTVNQAPLCSYSFSSSGTNFPASGGSGSFDVTVSDGCQWTATTSSPWILINSGSGNGNGSVTYTVQPNAQPARNGTITAGGQTFTIDQTSGCSFTLTSSSLNLPASNGTGGFTVNSGAGCMWTAVSNNSWINITSGNSGNGSGSVAFSVQSNAGQTRVGTITAGGQTFTINQAGYINRNFDFDGDNKTDISIFRPSVGEWWYLRSSDGGNYAAQFGNSSDKLVPADYTGDGKTDIAVWRPSTGEWFILRSENGSYYSFPFGISGDIPAVGDFDGDGKADSAVFRPSDSTWYIRRSSDGGFTIQQFGANGDVPAVADYDGDGKSDIAIWRASVGEWWIKKSSDSSVVAFQFGNSADKPVQGDYTGDGRADVAIFRPSTGEWFILRSEDFSYYSFPFGTNGDVPAPGDYDGDGKFDAAVFRPSNAVWYLNRSTSGTLITNFGIAGDTPVPSAYIP